MLKMNTSTKYSFDLTGYKLLVKHFLEQGYQNKNFDDAIAEYKHLILRHDVDISCKYAHDMALAEKEIGVHSTYFVLTRNPLYNVLTYENIEYLNKICDMGHRIGLHFDAALYEQDIDTLNRNAEVECKILETILERDVDIISFHRPAANLTGLNTTLAGRAHTYMPKYFSDMHYYADSRGSWRFGHPVDQDYYKAIQLLTHPIWWVFNDNNSAEEKLDLHVGMNEKNYKTSLSNNCLTYKKGISSND